MAKHKLWDSKQGKVVNVKMEKVLLIRCNKEFTKDSFLATVNRGKDYGWDYEIEEVLDGKPKPELPEKYKIPSGNQVYSLGYIKINKLIDFCKYLDQKQGG